MSVTLTPALVPLLLVLHLGMTGYLVGCVFQYLIGRHETLGTYHGTQWSAYLIGALFVVVNYLLSAVFYLTGLLPYLTHVQGPWGRVLGKIVAAFIAGMYVWLIDRRAKSYQLGSRRWLGITLGAIGLLGALLIGTHLTITILTAIAGNEGAS